MFNWRLSYAVDDGVKLDDVFDNGTNSWATNGEANSLNTSGFFGKTISLVFFGVSLLILLFDVYYNEVNDS